MAEKCDKTVIIITSVVGSLGVLSAISGIVAQAFPFLVLVIFAGIFLLAAQITVSAVSGCCGCCKSRAVPSETKRIVGIICGVGSWIVTATALVLLFFGIFAGTGILALVSTALGLTSFIIMRGEPSVEAAASGTNGTSQQQKQPPVVIMVGQPQFSPTEAPGARETYKPGRN